MLDHGSRPCLLWASGVGEGIIVRASECVACAPLCMPMWELELGEYSSIALLHTALRQSLTEAEACHFV